MVDEYRKRLNALKKLHVEGSIKRKDLVDKKTAKELSIGSEKDAYDILIMEEQLLNEASKEARKNSGEILERIVTRGIQVVYGEDVSMNVVIDERKNPVTAVIEVETEYADGVTANDPKDADGGGMADIVSLANIIGFNYLSKKNKFALALDEPTKYLSEGYSSLDVAKFLYEVSSSLQKQVFLVTHDKTIMQAGDKNFLFELDKYGATRVTNKKDIA